MQSNPYSAGFSLMCTHQSTQSPSIGDIFSRNVYHLHQIHHAVWVPTFPRVPNLLDLSAHLLRHSSTKELRRRVELRLGRGVDGSCLCPEVSTKANTARDQEPYQPNRWLHGNVCLRSFSKVVDHKQNYYSYIFERGENHIFMIITTSSKYLDRWIWTRRKILNYALLQGTQHSREIRLTIIRQPRRWRHLL